MALDVHQHLWPEPLLAALARRSSHPRLARRRDGWEVRLDAEPPSAFVPGDHEPDDRAALVAADGLDRALIALSSPLGIEALPAEESEPLLAAFHDGLQGLGSAFGWWGAVALDPPRPEAVDELVRDGAVGISLPALALADQEGLERVGPLLERAAARRVPVFVHPGPAPWRLADRTPPAAPAWWPALAGYVAQMHEAWHAFLAWGRPAHPELDVVWAFLAGGAPLHAERLAARGGPPVGDARSYYDVSSYGPRMVDAAVRAVGLEQLVYGSDRPVCAPPDLEALGPALVAALRENDLLARSAA